MLCKVSARNAISRLTGLASIMFLKGARNFLKKPRQAQQEKGKEL